MKLRLLASLLCLSFASAISRADSSGATVQSVPFETLAIGTQSRCVKPAKMLISGEAEWRRVWRAHNGQAATAPALPRVDWSRQRVVALLGGAMGGDAEISLARAVREGETLTLYFWRDAGSGRKVSRPFHFATVPFAAGAKLQVRFADAATMACPVCVGQAPATGGADETR